MERNLFVIGSLAIIIFLIVLKKLKLITTYLRLKDQWKLIAVIDYLIGNDLIILIYSIIWGLNFEGLFIHT